jgi:hypothetical protein
MSIGEVLIWESSNLLLLIPVVIGLVMYSKSSTSLGSFKLSSLQPHVQPKQANHNNGDD